MTRVAVVGAAGYAGIEAVRLVLAHERLELTLATSAADSGLPVAQSYPSLAGLTDLHFSPPDVDAIASAADVALLAVPHTAALELVPQLLSRDVIVVDLSADYRLQAAETYESWYGAPHTSPELLTEAVFGLPELDRSRLFGARLVACPGCYPTATTLAALPALAAGVVTGGRIIVDAKSGVSGAGRSATAGTHYVTVNEAVAPYKVAAHRHTPEIEQALTFAAGRPMSVVFAPHLVPMSRGLLSTVYLDVTTGLLGGRRAASSTVPTTPRSPSSSCATSGPCHRRRRSGGPTAPPSASRSTSARARSSWHARSTTWSRAPRVRPSSASTRFWGIRRQRVSTDPDRSSEDPPVTPSREAHR